MQMPSFGTLSPLQPSSVAVHTWFCLRSEVDHLHQTSSPLENDDLLEVESVPFLKLVRQSGMALQDSLDLQLVMACAAS